MTTEEQKIDAIGKAVAEIRADMRGLRTDMSGVREQDLPAIQIHLAQLNGSVARNSRDLMTIEEWRKSVPCDTLATELAFLREHDQEQDKKHKQSHANWGVVVTVIVGVIQAAATAVLLYFLIP